MKVRVLLPLLVTVAGLKLAPTPAGSVLVANPTVPLKPFKAPTVTVKTVLLPDVIVRLPGVPLTLKSGGGVTVRLTFAVCVRIPSLPEIVNPYVPGVTPVVVVTVSVELPLPVTIAGLNPALAPAGNPLTIQVTVPLYPFNAPTVVV